MEKRKMLYSAVVFVLLLFSGIVSKGQEHKSVLLQFDKQIDNIINQMTLEEKINMLHGKHMFVSAGVERLGIADINYADGPFGIREEMEPDSWKSLGIENDKATFFPTGSALAATWSPELAYTYGTAMGREARIRGKDMILGPAVNIQRFPTGGRTYEYFSEDPFLSSRLTVGYVKGMQDNGVAVCVKHYALNNQENNRGSVNVIVGERAMREIYLQSFRAAVVEADAYGFMTAYNKVAGKWCSENDILLNQILRKEWGFAGFTISDWGGTHSTIGAVTAGLNVEMPGKKYLSGALLDSVKAGKISEEIINQRVREILRVRFAIKPIPEKDFNKIMTSQPEQQKIAYEVASKSIVLLKNDKALPINLSKKPVIAVIGANAEQTMAQGGVGAGVKTLYEITPLDGLKNRIGDGVKLVYAKGYEPVAFDFSWFKKKTAEEIEKEKKRKQDTAQKLANEAVAIAQKADIIIFIAGDNRSIETEGSDRKDMFLPSGQDDLIKKIAEVNPNIITVITSAAPNDINVAQKLSKALIISWFNGSEGGNALADVILGNISPTGRLPFTLPFRLEDSPPYALKNYPQGEKGSDVFVDLVTKNDAKEKTNQNTKNVLTNDPNTAYYTEGSLVGYRWYDTKNIKVAYPFGYGLTYTTFKYSNLKTEKENFGKKDTIKLSFEIKNTGLVTADEVAQAYVHRIDSKIEWPLKELKAFSRIPLKAGETKTVTLEIPVKNLQYWDENTHMWSDDLCKIELLVGASATDIKLKKKVILK